MRWTTQYHKHGDTRIVSRFAWLPTRMTDPPHQTVWLERYDEHQEYRVPLPAFFILGLGPYWMLTRRVSRNVDGLS